MRNPLRSEAAAFRLLLGALGSAVLIAIAGLAGGGWAAVGVFAGIAAAFGYWLSRPSRPPGDGGRRR